MPAYKDNSLIVTIRKFVRLGTGFSVSRTELLELSVSYLGRAHVKSLAFRYFDGSNPPQELTNITTGSVRREIRRVDITLVVETEREALDRREKREITLRSSITPRNPLHGRNEL